MELKLSLPPGRSLAQLENHYLVEKEIAGRLMAATREERKVIYATMYDELFRRVPDHPRLSRRADEEATARSNNVKFALVGRFLEKSTVFLEYAPGDCRFVTDVASRVKYAYGLDISDQRRPGEVEPNNFELIVYDGYSLTEVPASSIDVIFSDQLIEHFHPEDTRLHFALAHRLLKKGGVYVFRTPHAFTGPHDVSMYFSDEPECFHLKEWTYVELRRLVIDVGYREFKPYLFKAGRSFKLPYAYCAIVERVFRHMPKRHVRRAARVLLPQVYAAVAK